MVSFSSESRETKTPEEYVKYKHQFRVESRAHRKFRPVCDCGKLRTSWKRDHDEAVRVGYKHQERQIKKEVLYREQVKTGRAGTRARRSPPADSGGSTG